VRSGAYFSGLGKGRRLDALGNFTPIFLTLPTLAGRAGKGTEREVFPQKFLFPQAFDHFFFFQRSFYFETAFSARKNFAVNYSQNNQPVSAAQ
jgi:hypothetical protein